MATESKFHKSTSLEIKSLIHQGKYAEALQHCKEAHLLVLEDGSDSLKNSNVTSFYMSWHWLIEKHPASKQTYTEALADLTSLMLECNSISKDIAAGYFRILKPYRHSDACEVFKRILVKDKPLAISLLPDVLNELSAGKEHKIIKDNLNLTNEINRILDSYANHRFYYQQTKDHEFCHSKCIFKLFNSSAELLIIAEKAGLNKEVDSAIKLLKSKTPEVTNWKTLEQSIEKGFPEDSILLMPKDVEKGETARYTDPLFKG